jgi:gamma-glutamyl-gamma-aminobutyrate hydrolase PuuD
VGICAVIRRVELPFGRVEAHAVFSAYVHAVANAGTMPVVLPCMDGTWAESLVSAVDGVVLTGGPDVAADHARDAAEIAMLHASLSMGRPLLGSAAASRSSTSRSADRWCRTSKGTSAIPSGT